MLFRPHQERQAPPVISKRVAPGIPSQISPPLQLTYSITLQKGQGSIPVAVPERTIFKGGDRFQLLISSAQAGHLYIVDEGPFTAEEVPQYVVLFPGRNTSSDVVENKEITIPSTDHWLRLDLERGREKIWFVFGKFPLPQFESLKEFINPDAKGEVKDKKSALAIMKFFTENRPKVESFQDFQKQQMRVKAKGEVLLYELLLEHQ
jgi:hypothetical protein